MPAATYPISFPSTPGAVQNTIRPMSVVAFMESPFSLAAQAQIWPGQRWEATVQLPKMTRANGEKWAAALTSLNGKEGSFLIGDTGNKTPQGIALSTAVISSNPAINNGGFETAGGGGADVFASWTENATGASTITRDTSVFDTGVASCKLVQDGSGSLVGIYQSLLTVGKRYRITLRAKNGGAGSLRVYDTAADLTIFALTNSWATYTFDFTANYALLELYASSTPSATVWIDSVQISPLDTYGGVVNGGSQTGYSLASKGWLAYQAAILKAGDWFQLGVGYASRLYKVMADVNTGINYFVNSSSFSSYSKTGLTIDTGAGADPYGTAMPSDFLRETAGSSQHNISQTSGISLSTGQTYAVWAVVAAGGRPFTQLLAVGADAVSRYGVFNLAAGTVTTSGNVLSATIQALSNGFYLIGITFAVTSPGAATCNLYASPDGATYTYVGDTTKGLYIAHYQFELNSIGPRVITTASIVSDPTTATIPLWPQLRSSPADGSSIIVVNPKGRFMLSKKPEWTVGRDHVYTFSDIDCMEDLRP